MSINLAEKYSKKIAQKHTTESLLAGKAKAPYDFTGVKSVNIYTLISQPLVDYDRTSSGSRYGEMKELQDSVQSIILEQDKGFKIAIDKGNNNEQENVKEAGRVMQMQIREQLVPAGDKNALKRWSYGAGKCLAYTGAVSKSNIISMLLDVEAWFADNFVPTDDRYIAVKNVHIKAIRLSDEFEGVQVRDELIMKGVVGKVGTLNIIGMPAAWLPEGVEHVAFHSRAVGMPLKIRDARVHTDSEDVSGAVLTGRFNFDAFVVGGVCDDVVVCVSAGKKAEAPTLENGGSATTISTTTSPANVWYTVDGSDPRWSKSRKLYTTAVTNPAAGEKIRAVAEYAEGGVYVSDLAEITI